VATDNQGYYEIKYTAKQFRRAGKKSADLFVRVFSKDGEQLGQLGMVHSMHHKRHW